MVNSIIVPPFEKQTITISSDCFDDYHIILQESSELHCSIALENINELDLTLNIDLNGLNAKAIINGYYVLKKSNSIQINVTLNHETKQTHSECNLKGVLFDQAYSKVKGLVSIEKQAILSQAHFENKVLIFDQAKAISIPTMEVKTHEVKCSHGSAIGRVDDEMLFYMQCRGLQRKASMSLLIDAFLQEVRR